MTIQGADTQMNDMHDAGGTSRKRSVGVTMLVVAVLTALLSAFLPATSASASAYGTRAKIACDSTRHVNAGAPASTWTRSTFAGQRLYVGYQLQVWTGSTWVNGYSSNVPTGNTGWFGYTFTNQYGVPVPPTASGTILGLPWVTMSGNGFMFFKYNVTPGNYYRVITSVWDTGDNTVTKSIQLTDPSNPSSLQWCQAR